MNTAIPCQIAVRLNARERQSLGAVLRQTEGARGEPATISCALRTAILIAEKHLNHAPAQAA